MLLSVLVALILTPVLCASLFIYGVIVVALGFLFMRMPTSYLPDEDQGILFAQILMPTGGTLEQT